MLQKSSTDIKDQFKKLIKEQEQYFESRHKNNKERIYDLRTEVRGLPIEAHGQQLDALADNLAKDKQSIKIASEKLHGQ